MISRTFATDGPKLLFRAAAWSAFVTGLKHD
ncbi:DUF397 domain-containing protein [Streptomyces sp. NPDC002870]